MLICLNFLNRFETTRKFILHRKLIEKPQTFLDTPIYFRAKGNLIPLSSSIIWIAGIKGKMLINNSDTEFHPFTVNI